VGVDIFFREAQRSWPELFPFADPRALEAAKRLGLDPDATALSRLVDRARLVDRDDFARLVTGLVRADLDGTCDVITAKAVTRAQ
jgi:hypothetical protein